MSADLHPFEAVCKLAAQRRWCWRIPCTTCGCMRFREAFARLLAGRHPSERRWRLPLRNEAGEKPDLVYGFLRDVDAQRRLADCVADARLVVIRDSAPHPDWLGYLGLALCFTAEAERATHRLTDAWLPQLNALVDGPPIYLDLLNYRDLGQFEHVVRR